MKPAAIGLELALLLAVAIGPVVAADQDSLQIVRAQQTALRAELDSGKLEGLTPRQLKSVRKAQLEVFALIEGKARIDALTIDDKVRLENALERINAEIKGTRLAGEERQVCWRERTSGTKMKVTRCGTQEEVDQAREGARAWMAKPKICSGPGCG